MRRFLLLSGCLAALLLSACTSGSGFPDPTGRGSVQAINAISTSPAISFLIEERTIANVVFETASTKTSFDDFEYTFNFEASLPNETTGEPELRRLASQLLQVVKEMEYTFVISGNLAAPTISVWERAERVYADGGTVFEASFGHFSPGLGDVDIYFDDAAIVPAAGNEIGTLTHGGKLPPIDVQAGDYVLTITTAGMPGDILFTSDVLTMAAATTLLFIIFDTDANDRGPVSVSAFNTEAGATINLIDPQFSPTVRFIHASQDLGTVDIYIDDPLTTPVIDDQDFLGISAEIEVPVGVLPITYTAFDNMGSPPFVDDDVLFTPGIRVDYYVVGEGASPVPLATLPDRRSIETLAKFTVVYTETNHGPLDLYIVEAAADIADLPARFAGLTAGLEPLLTLLPEGSYDLYLTVTGEKTVVVGPQQVDLVLGDVVTAIVYDAANTATADIVVIPDF
jgi:hypothetical protein